MDIEFHYFVTYLVAAAAGFPPEQAALIAHACQATDDNHIPIEVSGGGEPGYQSTVSQTMDILHPHEDEHIYPVFHFVPGNPHAPTAARVDGRTDRMVCTPDAAIAGHMMDAALAAQNPYRIGVASHAYADTWAHQNFTGARDDYNEFPAPAGIEPAAILQDGKNVALKIGHAPAEHMPDIPTLIWTDTRLSQPKVSNKVRFLDAAEALCRRYASALRVPEAEAAQRRARLREDLGADFGEPSPAAVQFDPARIGRYRARALSRGYGGVPIPEYRDDEWFSKALNESRSDVVGWLRERCASGVDWAIGYGDFLRGGGRIRCTWTDPAASKSTDWYRFQEAVRQHLEETWRELQRAGLVPGSL